MPLDTARSSWRSFLRANFSSLQRTESVFGFGELAGEWSLRIVRRFVFSRRTTVEAKGCQTRARRRYISRPKTSAVYTPRSSGVQMARLETNCATSPG